MNCRTDGKRAPGTLTRGGDQRLRQANFPLEDDPDGD
jgi:hypothetical protein